MLFEAAVGDAYGAGFEFVSREVISAHNIIDEYRPHALYPEILARYTDDTQMAIALAEVITQNLDWTESVIANKFVEVFKRDPRRGYSSGFYDLLVSVQNGSELVKQINPVSQRNGAAMRAYVLGVFRDTNEVINKAELQARITHNTPEAVEAAKAVALAAHYLLFDKGEVRQIGEYLTYEIGGVWNQGWSGEVGMHAYEAVRAAITLLKEENNLARILQRAVAFGGDTDTVAAIALGCASCSPMFARNLPNSLVTGLENGPFGRDYLVDLDRQLLKIQL